MGHGGQKQLFIGRLGLMNLLPGKSHEHRGTNRPKVGAPIELLRPPASLLRRHECRRPHRGAGLGRMRAWRASHPCNAEIEQLDLAALGHKDVVRLDVAVDDTLGVRGSETSEQNHPSTREAREARSLLSRHPEVERLAF